MKERRQRVVMANLAKTAVRPLHLTTPAINPFLRFRVQIPHDIDWVLLCSHSRQRHPQLFPGVFVCCRDRRLTDGHVRRNEPPLLVHVSVLMSFPQRQDCHSPLDRGSRNLYLPALRVPDYEHSAHACRHAFHHCYLQLWCLFGNRLLVLFQICFFNMCVDHSHDIHTVRNHQAYNFPQLGRRIPTKVRPVATRRSAAANSHPVRIERGQHTALL